MSTIIHFDRGLALAPCVVVPFWAKRDCGRPRDAQDSARRQPDVSPHESPAPVGLLIEAFIVHRALQETQGESSVQNDS